MQKEEFRRMLFEAIDEEYHHEVEEWLENTEKEFERIGNATKWPIEKIRDFYKLIGAEIGIGQGHEDVHKPEQ